MARLEVIQLLRNGTGMTEEQANEVIAYGLALARWRSGHRGRRRIEPLADKVQLAQDRERLQVPCREIAPGAEEVAHHLFDANRPGGR